MLTFINSLCDKYDLPKFQNAGDNFIMVMQAAEPTHEEKLQALRDYEAWILHLYADD